MFALSRFDTVSEHVQPGEEPLAGKPKDVVRFKAALVRLWDRLLSEVQDMQPVGDNDDAHSGQMPSFLATMLPFLAAFSGSNVRALRIGATACGLSLGSGLVACTVRACAARDTAQRQVQVAGGGARGAAAKAALEAAQAKVTACELGLKDVYTQLFTLRFRDTEPSIRADCIACMGVWIDGYTAFFLKDYYLKYLGWALNDKAPEVRVAALQAIRGAYSSAERASAMDTFIGRFAPRIVAMASSDVDDATAAAAVCLLGALHAHGSLPSDGSAAVLGALLDDSHVLRAAAAEVVPALLQVTSASASSAGTGAIQGVLRIMGAGPDCAQAADAACKALWDKLPALKEWDTLIEAATSSGHGPAGERATTDAVRLLAAAARKLSASGGEAFTGGAVVRGTKAAKDAAAKDRTQLSTALMAALPRLLTQHSAVPQRAGELADCVRGMALELYALRRNEAGFEALLQALTGCLFKQTAATPLASCARALAHCAFDGPPALQAAADKHARKALDTLCGRLKKLLPSPRSGGGLPAPQPGASDMALEVQLALARLRALQEAGFDPRKSGIEKLLSALLSSPSWCDALGDRCMALAASNVVHLLFLSLSDFGDAHSSGDAMDTDVEDNVPAACAALKTQRDAVLDAIVDLLRRDGASAKLKRAAFGLICDIAWAFSAPKLNPGGKAVPPAPPTDAPTALAALAWAPPAELLHDLWDLALAALPHGTATAASQQLFSQDVAAAATGDDDDDEDDVTEDAAVSDGAVPSDSLRSTHMLLCMARFVAFGLLPPVQSEWLAGRLMSLWAGHGALATELAKRGSMHAKKFSTLQAYERTALGALQAAYERHVEDECSSESASALRDTAAKIAASFQTGGHAVPVSARDAMARIVASGCEWALQGGIANNRLPFLTAALPPFIAKLTAASRAEALEALEKSFPEDEEPDSSDENWAPFFTLRKLLSQAAAGTAEKGGAKRGGARGGTARGRGAARRGRRTASDDDDGEPSDEVEDSDLEEGHEQRAVAPPAAAAAPRQRGARETTPAPGPGGWVAYGRAAKAPPRPAVAEEKDDDEEDAEDDAIEDVEEEEPEPVRQPRPQVGRKRRAALQLDDDDDDDGGSESEELPLGVGAAAQAAAGAAKKGRRG